MTDTAPTEDLWPDGVARHILPRSDSTNAEALRMAPNLSGPTWIMTRDQTAGRGRRGRGWSMPPGNFAATLLLRPPGGVADAARLSFVAALALYDALRDAAGPSPRLAIKWPNDVLLNGGKIAGILLESGGSGGRVDALAVGIGVNLAAAPPADALEPGAMPAVSLTGETGLTVPPDDFLVLLARAFDRWLRQMDQYGFAPIRTAWLARAAHLGSTITARTARTETTGTFEAIDDSGALVLLTAQGRQTIPAADIYFAEG